MSSAYLCAMHNQLTGHFSPPLLFQTKEMAVQTLVNELAMQNSELFPIREHLSLFCIGRYEVTSGKVSPYLFKKLLYTASDFQTQAQKEKENL